MPSNPPYLLKNNSKEIVFFGILHNDNYADSFSMRPGDYFSFDDITRRFYLSDELEQRRLRNDLLGQVGKTLTLTDKDGNAVTADQYNTDNPDDPNSQ